MKATLGVLGLLMLLGGIASAYHAANRDTSIQNADGARVNNIGLIADKQADVMFDAAIAVMGAIFFSTAAICEHLTPTKRELQERNSEREEQGAMLRALQAIASIPRTEAQTAVITGPRPPSNDPAFDAAIAEEMGSGHRAVPMAQQARKPSPPRKLS